MTQPAFARVADLVRSMVPRWRSTLSQQEADLAGHLRGNAPLYESLKAFISLRIEARASMPVPSEPLLCKASMERDAELRMLLARLDAAYRSPVNQSEPADGDQPA